MTEKIETHIHIFIYSGSVISSSHSDQKNCERLLKVPNLVHYVIDTRYLCGRGISAGDHYLQTIRIRIAPYFRQFAFSHGARVLEKDSYILDAKEWKKYQEERDYRTTKITI